MAGQADQGCGALPQKDLTQAGPAAPAMPAAAGAAAPTRSNDGGAIGEGAGAATATTTTHDTDTTAPPGKADRNPPRKKRRKDVAEIQLRDTAGLEVSPALAAEVIAGWGGDRLSEADVRQQDAVMQRLGKIAAKWTHRATASLYGSRFTGLGPSRGGDLDVCITFPGYDPTLLEQQQAAAQKKLRKLAISLHSKGFQSPKVIPNSRVELVTCRDAESGLQVDVTIGNSHGMRNSLLFRRMGEWVPELRPAMWLLKKLGKARRFVDPTSNRLSSYCVLTMLLCAGQQGSSPLFPVFHAESLCDVSALDTAMRAHTGCDAPARGEPCADVLRRLLAAFFVRFHSAARICVSPVEGFGGDSVDSAAHPLFVADILDGSNCARTVNPQNWVHTTNELGRAIEQIRAGTSLEALLAGDE